VTQGDASAAVQLFDAQGTLSDRGQKNHGLELAEQLDWPARCHSVSTGAAPGSSAVRLLRDGGARWIGSKRPRMIVLQAAAVRRSCGTRERRAERVRWENAHTIAPASCPAALGDALILAAIRQATHCRAVDDDAIDARGEAPIRKKASALPEPRRRWRRSTGARARSGAQGRARRIVNCAVAQKYPLPAKAKSLQQGGAIDFKQL